MAAAGWPDNASLKLQVFTRKNASLEDVKTSIPRIKNAVETLSTAVGKATTQGPKSVNKKVQEHLDAVIRALEEDILHRQLELDAHGFDADKDTKLERKDLNKQLNAKVAELSQLKIKLGTKEAPKVELTPIELLLLQEEKEEAEKAKKSAKNAQKKKAAKDRKKAAAEGSSSAAAADQE